MGQSSAVSSCRRLVFITSVVTGIVVVLAFLRSADSPNSVKYIHIGGRTSINTQTGETSEAKEEPQFDWMVVHRTTTDRPTTTNSQRSSIKTTAEHVSVCKEKTDHFVLVKIAKTGTTTMFSILARFAMSHRLNILHPNGFGQLIWTGKNDAKETWKIGPEVVDRADVFMHHAKYNKSIFDKYIKRDYKLIVPVKEPISWMRSAINHFGPIAHIKERNPNVVIENDNLLFKECPEKLAGLKTWFHLPQLQWLGFDYQKRGNLTEIQDFIKGFLPRIDIPVLNDQYDASLLIMKKRFCWEYTDIFYMSRNVRHSSRITITPQSASKIISLEVNLGDKLLYEAVNRTWWQQPELKKRDFWKEVTYFSKLNKDVSTQICPVVLRSNEPHAIEATDYHQVLAITRELCQQLRDLKQGCIKRYVNHTPC